MPSRFAPLKLPDCSGGTEVFQSLESCARIFIGSKLLKFIGLSAQSEPIFAFYTLDLSRYDFHLMLMYQRPLQFVRTAEMQGTEAEGDGSVLKYMTEPECRKQRRRLAIMTHHPAPVRPMPSRRCAERIHNLQPHEDEREGDEPSPLAYRGVGAEAATTAARLHIERIAPGCIPALVINTLQDSCESNTASCPPQERGVSCAPRQACRSEG